MQEIGQERGSVRLDDNGPVQGVRLPSLSSMSRATRFRLSQVSIKPCRVHWFFGELVEVACLVVSRKYWSVNSIVVVETSW
jgi:hypothetical protein